MVKLPAEVQKRVDILNEYTEDAKLNSFDIIHLYPLGLAYPNGYYDSKFFRCVIFNTKEMLKRDLGSNFDALDFWEGCTITKAQVFADGAFLVKLGNICETVGMTQMLCITPKDKK